MAPAQNISFKLYTLLFLLIVLQFACKQESANGAFEKNFNRSKIDSADKLMRSGKELEALNFINTEYRNLDNAPRAEQWAACSFKSTFYFATIPRLDSANFYADKMIRIIGLDSVINKDKFVHSLFLKANILLAKNDHDAAFRILYRAERFGKLHLDAYGKADMLNNIGLIFYRQKRFNLAIPHLKDALLEQKKIRNGTFDQTVTFPQGVMNTIGLSYDQIEQVDSAAKYYQLGLDFLDKLKNFSQDQHNFILSAKGVIYGNLGGMYDRTGDFKKAEQYLKSSIEINDRKGFSPSDAITAKIKLISLYQNLGKIDASKPLLNEIKLAISKMPDNGVETKMQTKAWLYYYSQYLELSGNYKSSLAYLKSYHKLKRALDVMQQATDKADIDRGLKIAEQEHNLILLEKEGNFKMRIIVLSFFVIIISIFALFLVFRNLKLSKAGNNRLSILNDQITKSNNQLSKTIRAYEESEEENERMYKMMAHDLRGPLSGIVMAISLLETENGLTDSGQQMLEVMKMTTNDSIHLINDVLIKGRDENVLIEKINLREVSQSAIDILQFKASEKSIDIHLKAENIWYPIKRNSFLRVVHNLIGNAIKFSPLGQSIQVELYNSGDWLIMTFRDNGVGIPSHLQKNLFSNDGSLGRKGTSGEESFGLGLSISKQIIEMAGGRIDFESEENVGTVFTVRLPKT